MKPAFDIKSARLDVLAIHLHTADLTELEEFLRQRAGQYQELDIVPFVLDVQDFDHPESLDIGAMLTLFARYGMQILGLRHESESWSSFAARYHLVFSRSDKSEPQQPKINQSLPPFRQPSSITRPSSSAPPSAPDSRFMRKTATLS